MSLKKTTGKKSTLPKTEQGLRLALQRLAKRREGPRVTDLYYMMDVDGYGEEYLKVYAILDDRDADPVPSRAKLAPIVAVIRDALKKQVDCWVSVSFRSQSEQNYEMNRRGAIIKPVQVKAA